MSRNKRILFDKEITDMVKSLSEKDLKYEIEMTALMIDHTQASLSELLAYKDFLYREAWARGQDEDKDNQD